MRARTHTYTYTHTDTHTCLSYINYTASQTPTATARACTHGTTLFGRVPYLATLTLSGWYFSAILWYAFLISEGVAVKGVMFNTV